MKRLISVDKNFGMISLSLVSVGAVLLISGEGVYLTSAQVARITSLVSLTGSGP
jgi:hypothetical protein